MLHTSACGIHRDRAAAAAAIASTQRESAPGKKSAFSQSSADFLTFLHPLLFNIQMCK